MLNNASEANSVFRDMLGLKNQRKSLTDKIDSRKAHLIMYLKQNGPTLVYNGEKPTIIEVVKKSVKQIDKAALAYDLGIPANSLTPIRIAKLVEDGKLTYAKILEYQYEEEDYRLRQHKAKKKEIEKFRNQK
ncbi:hypothetical protein MUO14_23960 [Halobacillus shinanisalinarum]|uniref:Uncharacterized protein n=1 Tax=Halobacillus shinanisalinarum TaxID=2932258 RepID=A0ABY4GYV1_9BACI|nr:hypothetical protein [Halobacillus shinanisalinarum]UOQ93387.1 hypothetical protein MUO14_23960 [Halobacillus shinanisalinarum]